MPVLSPRTEYDYDADEWEHLGTPYRGGRIDDDEFEVGPVSPRTTAMFLGFGAALVAAILGFLVLRATSGSDGAETGSGVSASNTIPLIRTEEPTDGTSRASGSIDGTTSDGLDTPASPSTSVVAADLLGTDGTTESTVSPSTTVPVATSTVAATAVTTTTAVASTEAPAATEAPATTVPATTSMTAAESTTTTSADETSTTMASTTMASTTLAPTTTIAATTTTAQPTTTVAPAPPAGNDGAKQQAILDLVNAERSQAGCGMLALQPQLNAAADGHSEDMATQNYFDHTGLNGSKPWDRAADAGYGGGSIGENIAQGYSTAESVMNGWMNSSGHRANILNCNYTHLGVGYASGARPHYWTQVFGAGG